MIDATLLRKMIGAVLTTAGIDHAAVEADAIVKAAGQRNPSNVLAAAVEAARQRVVTFPKLPGRTLFMGVPLSVLPGVLVLRDETELLGYSALAVLSDIAGPALVIDMCCGAGNLACALAMLQPSTRVWAADLTDAAVGATRANVERLQLGDRVTVVQGDLFAPLASLDLEGRIDAIVCNPPYISTGKLEKERTDLLIDEPREAFDGGPYGVSIFQRVLRDAVPFLRPGGRLLFEIGAGQGRQVTSLFARNGQYEPVDTRADHDAVPRVVIGRKRTP